MHKELKQFYFYLSQICEFLIIHIHYTYFWIQIHELDSVILYFTKKYNSNSNDTLEGKKHNKN